MHKYFRRRQAIRRRMAERRKILGSNIDSLPTPGHYAKGHRAHKIIRVKGGIVAFTSNGTCLIDRLCYGLKGLKGFYHPSGKFTRRLHNKRERQAAKRELWNE